MISSTTLSGALVEKEQLDNLIEEVSIFVKNSSPLFEKDLTLDKNLDLPEETFF
jgi:hypothetical protein